MEKYIRLTKENLEWLNFIPEGWGKSFGTDLRKELDEVLVRENIEAFEIIDVKEKWGELRIYFFPQNDEIEKVIDKYSMISRSICLACGSSKPCAKHPYY